MMLPCSGTLGRRSRTGVVLPSSSRWIFQTIINSNLYRVHRRGSNVLTRHLSVRFHQSRTVQHPRGSRALCSPIRFPSGSATTVPGLGNQKCLTQGKGVETEPNSLAPGHRQPPRAKGLTSKWHHGARRALLVYLLAVFYLLPVGSLHKIVTFLALAEVLTMILFYVKRQGFFFFF